jgi:hypothetical protein
MTAKQQQDASRWLVKELGLSPGDTLAVSEDGLVEGRPASGPLAAVALESNASGEILWDTIYALNGDAVVLPDLPEGLGLAFVDQEASAVLAATEVGVWQLTLTYNFDTDDTALIKGSIKGPDYLGARQQVVQASVVDGAWFLDTVLRIDPDEGTNIVPSVTASAATAPGYEAPTYTLLQIQRLA